jgi:hypothetical protein
LTRGRDIFPVWGRHWIAFSRYPKTCAYARRIWRVRTDGSDAQPVTGPPPPGYSRGGYYGFDSRDGRVALVDSGGSEGPQTIAAVTLADGRRHALAHGDVAFPSWNR